jgi:wyosine [tRNA(Phe)-imidazoG37] synthetase (radical SAM superfamily)
VPSKTCNFNCVYCQLGRTHNPVCDRASFIDVENIATEFTHFASSHGKNDVDWVTFVGSGETTLHSELGALISLVKSESDFPVAVITNGSLLYRPEVRQDLISADAVLPSLDAGTSFLFRRINRPHPLFTFDQHVEGFIAFRQIFTGKLWIEVMLVRGVNDTTHSLDAISAALERIQPDEVHITLPTRPPAETWVEPADSDGIQKATAIIGGIARVFPPADISVMPDMDGDVIDAVHTIVSRHPLREVELVRLLAERLPGRVFETLAALTDSGKIRVVERYGIRFWCAASAEFPDVEEPGGARPANIHDPNIESFSQP